MAINTATGGADKFFWSNLATTGGFTQSSFDVLNDVFIFDRAGTAIDDDEIAAADVSFSGTTNTVMSYTVGVTTKTVTLTGVTLAQLTTTTTAKAGNIRFNDGSVLIVGDNTTNTTADGAVNTLLGGIGNDQLIGLGGNDSLDGGAGADKMIGGTGNDSYIIDNTGDVVVEGSTEGTADTITINIDTAGNTYTLGDAVFVENLILSSSLTVATNVTGNASDNTITGNSKANTLSGGGGNDIFLVGGAANGGGIDAIFGGTSGADSGTSDTVSYAGTTVSVTANLTTGTAGSTQTGNDTLSGIENLIGGSAIDTLTGDGNSNILDGGVGADFLNGGGGTGSDTFIVDSTSETISGVGSGTSDLVIASASYSLTATGLDNLTLVGTAANGTGNSGANIIIGNASANTLSDGGNSTVSSNDLLNGGAGNDIYNVTSTLTIVSEAAGFAGQVAAGGGVDRVISTVSFTLDNTIENLTLTGAAPTSGIGNSLANRIDASAVTLAGTITLTGGAGDDVYVVSTNAGTTTTIVEQNTTGSGTDTVESARASYTLANNVEKLTLIVGGINGTGNNTANTITGNTGNNILDGAGGDDTVSGGNGNDTLRGGTGNDTLIGDATVAGTDFYRGGAGNDTINTGIASGDTDTVIFESSASANGVDSINNFLRGATADKLDFNLFFGDTTQLFFGDATTGSFTVNFHSTTPVRDVLTLTGEAATTTATVAGEVLLVRDTGTALTTTTVAALFGDSGSTTTVFEDDISDAAAEKYVVISASSTGGNASIWFVDSSIDQDATDITADDVTLVGTLTSVNFATGSTAFNAANLVA